MPIPIKDITGHRFGSLVAISARRVDARTLWTFRCDCGRQEEYRIDRMQRAGRPPITACTECSKVPCVICGTPFSRVGSGTTCGDPICKQALKRLNDGLFRARKTREIEESRKRRHLAKMEAPEYAQTRRERLREYKRSPEGRAAVQRYKEKHAEEISEYHRRYRENLTDERKQQIRENAARHKTKKSLLALMSIGEKLEGRLNDE